MAYGSFSRMTLLVNSRSENTVGWITEVLESLEYAYNLGAIVEVIDGGETQNIRLVAGVLRVADRMGVHVTFYVLRMSLAEAAQLRIERVSPAGSFKLSVAGIAKVIDALARVFDPSMRAERRETLRHQAAMNNVKEREAELDLAVKIFESVRAFSDPKSNFTDQLERKLGPEGAKEMQSLLAAQFRRAIADLPTAHIDMIEPPMSTP